MNVSEINSTLERYGACITMNNLIQKNDKVLPVMLYQKGKRLYFEDIDGNKLFSGPAAPNTITKFVELFWFWRAKQ